MTDVDLFGDPIPVRDGYAKPDPPRVRNTDPTTSRQAADSLDNNPGINSICWELYELIAGHPRAGLTTADIVIITGYDRGNTARRITDLQQAGLVRNSGRTRRNPATGRAGIVWETA